MGDSPRSEKFDQTRFSTPVSELDDHRHQPSSLPRADTMDSHTSPGTRRGTVESISFARADLRHMDNVAHGQGMIARDFEEVIVDDDNDAHLAAPAYDAEHCRRDSQSPSVARKNTFRRNRRNNFSDRTRTSSLSSRSVSPPNSVEAFAEPRRRERANTANSKAPSTSDLNLGLALTRTVSRASRRSRRTFEDGKPPTTADNASSHHGSAQDDVCFPPEIPDEARKTYAIDFEDLEDLVAERAARHEPKPQVPASTKVFNDLRPTGGFTIPSVVLEDTTTLGGTLQEFTSADAVNKDKEIDCLSINKTFEAKPPQPEAPNRWTFFSSELDDAIQAPELGELLLPGESFRDMFQLGPDGGFWWLDIQNPSEMEVQGIAKAFHLHGLTREDIVQQEAREKVELFRSYYFVCFRSFRSDPTSEDYLEPLNVYAVVFREGVLSFTYHPNSHAAKVRKRLDRLRDHVEVSPDWICYALIDDIVDSFQPAIHEVEQETDSIEDNVFTVRAEDSKIILRQIGQCRKKVMSLLRLVGGKADVIKGFAKRCNEQYSITPRSHVGLFLSDVQDHVVTFSSNLSHFEKILSRSHSNYLAQISVDNIEQGNRVNVTLGKVTFIATILVPLNLVCGLFGMNQGAPSLQASNSFFLLRRLLYSRLVELTYARQLHAAIRLLITRKEEIEVTTLEVQYDEHGSRKAGPHAGISPNCGKGTPRRKVKKVHKSAGTDDKKLQTALKKLAVQPIQSIEEVNMFKKDGNVIHFAAPKVHASVPSNTFAIYGAGEDKELTELVPGILNQLGPDSLASLRKLAESYQSLQKEKGEDGDKKDDDDDIPDLVEGENFEGKAEVE